MMILRMTTMVMIINNNKVLGKYANAVTLFRLFFLFVLAGVIPTRLFLPALPASSTHASTFSLLALARLLASASLAACRVMRMCDDRLAFTSDGRVIAGCPVTLPTDTCPQTLAPQQLFLMLRNLGTATQLDTGLGASCTSLRCKSSRATETLPLECASLQRVAS